MSYQEDVARWQRHANARAQRQWKNANETYQDLQTQYHETLEEADRAQEEGDQYSLNNAYDELTRIEGEIAPYEALHRQQQQAKPHPVAAWWDWKNKDYRDRLERRLGPQGAAQAFAMADGIVTRPRIPSETNWQRTGMGLQRYSPGYVRAIEDVLETYSGEATGVPYSAKEQLPDLNQAAEISGLSPQDYQRARQALKAQGRVS
jgi:hypothetical protein